MPLGDGEGPPEGTGPRTGRKKGKCLPTMSTHDSPKEKK